jgi:hypothetical protein
MKDLAASLKRISRKRQEVTKAVAPVTCKKYAESFMKRINLCISLKGAHTGY